MIVIADTSPINYLVQISEIEVLPKLYDSIMIPPSVRNELAHPRAARDTPVDQQAPGMASSAGFQSDAG